MKTFWKINVISILYAVLIIIPVELYVNVTRISRITGWDLNVVGIGIGVAAIVSVICLSTLIIYLTKGWLEKRKSSFWSVLLWLPYFIFFIFIFASLFPVTDPADEGGPGDGLIILALLAVYPFYVFLLNAISVLTTSVAENK